MKRIILSLFVFFVVSSIVTAQEIRLNAFSKYVFDDKVDSYYSSTSYFEGTIEGGFQWGLGLEYMAHPTKGIELKYLRQEAQVPMSYYLNGVKTKTFDVNINYVLLGGNNYFKTGGKVEPYGGLGIGMAIFKIQNPESSSTDDSAIKFAWELKLGTNIWVSEKVGIKLQADLASAVQSAGGGLYFGTGGAGAGVSTYSTMYQWGLGGGLTFKLK
ncbi:MAG: porin family protein [Bacteroidales bacterium]|nr:porin family protein [Bacteroidales bacterium]